MKASSEDLAALLGISVFITIGMVMGSAITQETTSNWWKIQIVSRGYGTWETTTDGQVWFKWKEEEVK